MGVSVLAKQEETMCILLEDLMGNSQYSIDMYLDNLTSILNERKSLYLSIAYENCVHFGISPLFIYLLESELNEVRVLLLYEIIHLNKYNLLTDEQFKLHLIDVLNEEKSESRIAKEVLENIGFIFTDKSYKKNSLFRVYEGLYELSPFPILDSASCLSKLPTSKKYKPSDIVAGRINRIHYHSILSIVSKLSKSSSSYVILSTLRRYFVFYKGTFELSSVICRIPRERMINSPRVKVLSQELLSLLNDYLIDEKPVLNEIISVVNLI